MGKSYAEMIEEKAAAREAIKASHEMLVLLLRTKFPDAAPAYEPQILARQDVAQLDTWTQELVRARRVKDISFPPVP